MDRKEPKSVAVAALRAVGLSPDGKAITLCLSTRYSTAERLYSVPVECFYDLIVDLRRLNTFAKPEMLEVSGLAEYSGEAAD